MELRDLGGALGRHKLMVLTVLVITGLAVALGPRLAPTTYPSSSQQPFVIAVAAVAACVLAGGVRWLYARLAGTVDDGAGVEAASSAPLLAHLAPPRDPTTLPALCPGTRAADSFRHLRIALEAEAGGSIGRVVVAGVTSGDVVVWLGANLAIALAGSGRRVLLVDGRMGERFGRRTGEPETAGLYDVLAGTPLAEALSPGPTDRLTVLPSGSWGIEPARALAENRFAEVMASAQAQYDVVVVLAPPLDVCEDARVLAAGASLLLAVPEGHLRPAALRAHADRSRSVGARLLGVVLVSRRPERVPV